MIKLLRIDHRLIHGQVAFSWTQELGADCILLANDDCTTNQIRRTAISLAKPPGVKLVIKGINDAIKAINEGKTDNYKLFVVVESVEDAYKLITGCDCFKELNLGGAIRKENSTKLGPIFYVTNEEIEMLNKLVDKGIDVYIQQIPSDAKESYKKLNERKDI